METTTDVSLQRCQGEKLSCVEVILAFVSAQNPSENVALIEVGAQVGREGGWTWPGCWYEFCFCQRVPSGEFFYKTPKMLSSGWIMINQACNDEKLNHVTSSSSYPSPITMPNRWNQSITNILVPITRVGFCLVVAKVKKICQEKYRKIVLERHPQPSPPSSPSL